MEIHPPEKPLHSVRDVLLQLMTITLGILIALSLEGLVEWLHHRKLVAEAKENIRQELQDNRTAVRNLLGRLPEADKNFRSVLNLISTLEDKRSMEGRLSISYSLAQVRETSWQTASATGALGHMKYSDAKKFAEVYELQRDFLRLQQRVLDDVVGVTEAFVAGDFTKLRPAEYQMYRERVRASIGKLTAQKQISESLLKGYDEALKE